MNRKISAAAAPLIALCACTSEVPPAATPVWSPGVVYASEPTTFRGFLDVRGLVHAHSVYSHDACDGKPVDETGARDAVCFDDFRRDLCAAKHDFVFLTDHRDGFEHTEFPEALLYREERGDALIVHDGLPTANLAACPDGTGALIMAGNESAMMPVGLESHVPGRGSVYGTRTAEAAATMRDHGAVVLLAHPEDFTAAELIEMPVDGFEMYNLHANSFMGLGVVLDLLLRVQEGDDGVPHPDLMMLSFWSEDERYVSRWGSVLNAGRHIVTTMGTDCHRNTFTVLLGDGERADSYRRMMIAFSNHLRIRANDDGAFDDRSLKEALRAGRNYGAFEMLGYPVGFDVVAVHDASTYEFGEEAPVGATLMVQKPAIKDLDPTREAPRITVRVLKARDQGFDEIAVTTEDILEVPLDAPGAYRVEVRMMPTHLREDMNDDAVLLLDEHSGDYVWIYSGALYVR